jgi:hypothetical protein
MGDGDKGYDKYPIPPPPDTSARARVSACRELGKAFAELLSEDDSHQLGVCAQLGIPWRKHMRWMAADAEPGTDVADYQSEVMAALDRQRRLDLEQGQTQLDGCHPAKSGAQFNMFKFRHESRFKRFYEETQKHEIELTGKEGGPVEVLTSAREKLGAKLDELAERNAKPSGDASG